jgi:hypothetical protein
MSTQIKNNTVGEIIFYIGAMSQVRLLPGINIIPDADAEELVKHPILKTYKELGQLEVTNLNLKGVRDENFNITTITDTDGEQIPVTLSNNGKIKSIETGAKFTTAQLKSKAIPRDIAARIIGLQESLSWQSVSDIVTAIKTDDAELITKLESLF